MCNNIKQLFVTDTFTYPNFISLANMLNIQLITLRNDEHGMIPSELDSICRNNKINGIYLMPSVANPTNISMNLKRRIDISRLITRYGLILIEDDAYAFLAEEKIKPMAMLVPEQSVYINGISKAISAGLRIAYMRFPERYRQVIENAIYNINLKTPALNLEIATEIIRLGISNELILQKKQAAKERNKLFADYFGDMVAPIKMFSHFQWLPLPEGCSGKVFEFICTGKGVNLYGSERFSAGDN
ncbi:aminotransferase class I/II-fold pyridoxal phosphate-dependent enzyme [Paenibacillus sp. NPDC058174]|uniref:aminotransferase class I/II-fold pyridoxal phosphate-dependent enzyme n=1 Tax=Paenibacillus sp. NPDC058174 TaxID=3346366 RepID=UPI0036D9A7C3